MLKKTLLDKIKFFLINWICYKIINKFLIKNNIVKRNFYLNKLNYIYLFYINIY